MRTIVRGDHGTIILLQLWGEQKVTLVKNNDCMVITSDELVNSRVCFCFTVVTLISIFHLSSHGLSLFCCWATGSYQMCLQLLKGFISQYKENCCMVSNKLLTLCSFSVYFLFILSHYFSAVSPQCHSSNLLT